MIVGCLHKRSLWRCCYCYPTVVVVVVVLLFCGVSVVALLLLLVALRHAYHTYLVSVKLWTCHNVGQFFVLLLLGCFVFVTTGIDFRDNEVCVTLT